MGAPRVRHHARARRDVVAGGARRRGRRAARRARRAPARARSRCSAAPTARTRTRTRGRASPRACCAPTTSTRSSATGSRPRSCSGCRGRRSPTSTGRAAIVLVAPGPQAGAPGPLPARAACGRRPRRPADRRVARATTGSRSTRPRCCVTCRARRAPRWRRSRVRSAGRVDRARTRSTTSPAGSRAATVRSSSCSGAASVAEPADSTVHAAAEARRGPGRALPQRAAAAPTSTARSTSASRPGFLPGRVTLDAGCEHFAEAWGAVPELRGPRRRRASCARPADGGIEALVLVDADPLVDFPDRALAERRARELPGRDQRRRVRDGAATRADIVLPTTVWGEQAGTRHEPRGSGAAARAQGHARSARRCPRGGSRPSSRCASAPTSTSRPSKRSRTRSHGVAPAFAGVDDALLRRARDGVGAAAVRARRRARRSAPAASRPASRGSRSRPRRRSRPPKRRSPKRPAAEAPAADAGADARRSTAPAVPAAPLELFRWNAAAEAVPSVPVDAYALRLVAGRTLYGSDRVVVASPSLASLARRRRGSWCTRFDRDRLGVDDGAAGPRHDRARQRRAARRTPTPTPPRASRSSP